MSPDPFTRLEQTATFAGGGHQLWRESVVVVVGAGNVGSRFAIEAVRSGARIWICDLDRGDTENLGTQLVDIDKFKAESVADRCNAIFPDASPRAEYLAEDIRLAGAAVLHCADVIVDATDDPGLARYLTNLSNGLGKPLVRIALDGGGEREMGRVLVSDGGNGRSCQLCTHEPAAPSGKRTPCDRRFSGEPTLAGNAVGMAIAGVGLLQTQRLVTGRDPELVLDREVLLDLTSMRLLPQILERSADCISHHELWEVVQLDQAASDVNPELLFDRARDQRGDVRVTLEVHQPHELLLRFDRRQGVEAGLIGQPLSRLGLPPTGGLVLARTDRHPPIAYLMC